MKQNTIDELDLAIHDLNSEQEEQKAAATLRRLPGVESVRMVQRGAFITYRSAVISKEQICQALRQIGFRAATFQDSHSGKVGKSSA